MKLWSRVGVISDSSLFRFPANGISILEKYSILQSLFGFSAKLLDKLNVNTENNSKKESNTQSDKQGSTNDNQENTGSWGMEFNDNGTFVIWSTNEDDEYY